MLNVENLVIHYETDEEVVEAVNNISFRLKKGEVLGLVGETGAGKTTTALGIMGLLPPKVGHVIQGKIELDGENLFDKSEREMRNIRGKKLSGSDDGAESGKNSRRADRGGGSSA